MKTTNQVLIALAMLLLCVNPLFAQDEQPTPQFYTVTTMHWDMNYDGDDDWMAIEKEYLEKVTSKNEHILGSGFYMHRWTADNTELLYVNVYADWNSIDKGAERTAALIKEAWPDKEARNAFLNKRDAFYSDYHSDEIYAVIPGTIHNPAAMEDGKDRILYYRTSHFSFPEDGTNEEFDQLQMEFVNNVIKKNEVVKGYYPHVHAWGSDKREFKEAIILDSMDDLEKMNQRNGELVNEYWKDEEARKTFFKKFNKYTTGFHGDAIYTEIANLRK